MTINNNTLGPMFQQFQFSGLNWSHMRDLGGFFGPIFVIFRRASFFVKIPQSRYSMIYTILSFSGYIFPTWMLSQMFQSPDPAARPSARPSARHGSQVIKLVRVPVFLSSKLSQTGSCSSISQFKTDETGSFSNIFLIPINSDGISK